MATGLVKTVMAAKGVVEKVQHKKWEGFEPATSVSTLLDDKLINDL